MKKRGALVTLLALVALLVLAVVGRNVLSSRQVAATQERVKDEVAVASEDGEDATSVGATEEPASTDTALLADYDATVYTDQGESVQLTDLADGKPLVINFWATWCPYCVDELPDFQQIVADYGNRVSFAFVDVADGRRERPDDARAWLVEQGFDDLPAYYDNDLAASTAFGAWSLPTTVVVSAEGEIVNASAGRIDPALLRGALNTLV